MFLAVQFFDCDDLFLDLLRGTSDNRLPDSMTGITYILKAEDRLHSRI